MKKETLPLISVIVPVYNVEKYIGKCLESICCQTYSNLEIIVVNDGSTDNSRQIVLQWTEKDKRIVFLEQQNSGVSVARNLGIEKAHGEYIAFVDSDDYIADNMYMELYHLLKKSNCNMVVCGYMAVDDDGKPINEKYGDPKEKIYSEEEYLWTMQDNVRIHTSFICPWNKLYLKSLFDDIRFPAGKVNEDNWIIHKLVYKTHKVAYINQYLYYYRQAPGSIMRGKYSVKRFDDFEAQVDRIKFLDMKRASKELINRMGRDSVQSGINCWFQIKYYKCTSEEEEKGYYKKVKPVVERFGNICLFPNRVKSFFFCKMPNFLYGLYCMKRRIMR